MLVRKIKIVASALPWIAMGIESFFSRLDGVLLLLLSGHIGVLGLHLGHDQGAKFLQLSHLLDGYLGADLKGLHTPFRRL